MKKIIKMIIVDSVVDIIDIFLVILNTISLTYAIKNYKLDNLNPFIDQCSSNFLMICTSSIAHIIIITSYSLSDTLLDLNGEFLRRAIICVTYFLIIANLALCGEINNSKSSCFKQEQKFTCQYFTLIILVTEIRLIIQFILWIKYITTLEDEELQLNQNQRTYQNHGTNNNQRTNISINTPPIRVSYRRLISSVGLTKAQIDKLPKKIIKKKNDQLLNGDSSSSDEENYDFPTYNVDNFNKDNNTFNRDIKKNKKKKNYPKSKS